MGELLLEVGVEEVPALLMRPTLDQLRDRARELLHRARLEAGQLSSFGTPRRLVLSAMLPARQEAAVTTVTGPPKAAAYDAAGQPTAAAIGFAKSHGVAIGALQIERTTKGDYLAVRKHEAALPAAGVLRQLLPELLGQLQFPKTMRWNDSGGRFIRPVRWIVALLDREVIPFSFAGLTSGRRSVGHRALAPKAVTVARASDYRRQMARAYVLVDDAERAGRMARDLGARGRALGASLVEDDTLRTQTVYSCEWPAVAAGAFDRAYLELPDELLLAVLLHQQGYVALRRPSGELLPKFLCVIDGGTARGGAPLPAVVRGHERVLRARLDDARFYVRQDLTANLSDRVETLKGVTFHDKLGTLHDKTMRLVELAGWLAPHCGVEVKEAERAALLCKADLVTGLVREFPELQGAIGGDYAARQGESAAVARAIGEHYRPRWAGDALPAPGLGRLLSLADKIDTIVGYFGIGLAPTGSEDPYALRRQAAGAVQLAGEYPRLDLFGLVTQANAGYAARVKGKWLDDTVPSVHKFLVQRLEWQLLSEGNKNELVSAVLGGAWKNPATVKRWLSVLQTVLSAPAGEDLLVVYRRVGRIVPDGFSGSLQPSAFTEPEERGLHQAWETARRDVTRASDEAAALTALARLRPAVDAFFGKVMVMVDDQAVQTNRLALVNAVRALFQPIADFSKISAAPAGKGREA